MNSKFTDEQIKVYAAQFIEGDAIWCGGEWRKVSKSTVSQSLRCESPNRYVIHCYDGEVAIDGFKEEENAYRVTTIDDYELQGGEKVVWLGGSDSFRTFGKSYEVDEGKKYCCDDGISLFVLNNLWGIIPRCEMHIQVKNNSKRNVSDEEFDNFLNDLDKTLAPVKKDNQLEHVVHYSTAADREEEVLKIKTFDLLNHDMSKEEIITDLKEIAHIEINNGNYDIVNKVVELVKEWEGMK